MSTDFTAIHAALERLRAAVVGELTPEEIERVLTQRARLLAARAEKVVERPVLHQVVAVRRGDSVLGLPIHAVREIRQVTAVALPHATDWVQGLFQLRGDIACLVDVQPFFGPVSPMPANAAVLAALVHHRGETFGLRIDELYGPRTVYADECVVEPAAWAHDFVIAMILDVSV
jgi:chemotaxis signal transduction protein